MYSLILDVKLDNFLQELKTSLGTWFEFIRMRTFIGQKMHGLVNTGRCKGAGPGGYGEKPEDPRIDAD